MKENMFVN